MNRTGYRPGGGSKPANRDRDSHRGGDRDSHRGGDRDSHRGGDRDSHRPKFAYSKPREDGDRFNPNRRERDRSYGNNNPNNYNNAPRRDYRDFNIGRFDTNDNDNNNNNNSSAPYQRNNSTYRPNSSKNNSDNTKKTSFANTKLDEPDELPMFDAKSKPKSTTQLNLKPEPVKYTDAQLQNFDDERQKLDNTVHSKLKYIPYVGTIEQNPTYKPFINAIHNLGGITHFQLYQLHLYTQCLLASQRHKFDLSVFSDGYYTNAAFPDVPEYFPYLNVTALRRPDLIFNQHLADALSIIPTIEAHVPEITTPNVKTSLDAGKPPTHVPLQIVDVGSGGGVPAIILAIMRPSWEITAIDTVGKKCNFLRHTADRLGLANFTVISGSAQHYCSKVNGEQVIAEPLQPIGEYGNQKAMTRYQDKPTVKMFENYDICVARGVTQMPQLLPICMPLVKPGGKFIAMKALLSSLPRSARPDTHDDDQIAPTPKVKNSDATILNNLRTDEDLEIDFGSFATIETQGSKKSKQEDSDAAPDADGSDNDVADIMSKKGKKEIKADRGEAFKKDQADAIKKMDNYDSLINAVLSSPWVPSGRYSPAYAQLSLELQESLPNLQQFGCGKDAKPVYVHTDLFFQVALPAKNNGILARPKDVSEDKKERAAKKFHPYNFDPTIPRPQDNGDGKVGETAKYLCIIDKLASVANKQEEIGAAAKKNSKDNNVKKVKPLREKDFVRASKNFQFDTPYAAVNDETATQSPKVLLKKKYHQEKKQRERK